MCLDVRKFTGMKEEQISHPRCTLTPASPRVVSLAPSCLDLSRFALRSHFCFAQLFVTIHTRLKQEEAERRLQCIFTPVCSTVSRPWCSQVLITHSVSKTRRKEVLIGARGCVMHTGLSELFLFMCRSASALSRSAWMHIFMGVLDPCTAGPP